MEHMGVKGLNLFRRVFAGCASHPFLLIFFIVSQISPFGPPDSLSSLSSWEDEYEEWVGRSWRE